MCLAPKVELEVRLEALAAGIVEAGRQGMLPDGQIELWHLVIHEHSGAFRRALVGDPPADVGPRRVRRNAATLWRERSPVRCRRRRSTG